ncbi:MAG TPA: 4-alpha-glucanotransferase [Thermoleophilaceae bacterium]
MKLPRSSGVQLHPTSLPSGRLGRDAYAFVDWLADAGQSWWQMLPLGPPDRYGSPYKSPSAFAAWPGLLEKARARVTKAEEDEFRSRHSYWIGGWEKFAGEGAVADQVRFEREWSALRGYANERGVRLIGDVPIYVAPRGADHRAHPHLFQKGWVAGTPPDAYAASGQLWGNPLYDWPAMRREGYRWWVERMRRTFELHDLARIDHFRGFVAYWAVPSGVRTALHGHWKRGPGRAVFDAVIRELGHSLPVIAEDLGVITPPVERLRDSLGLPGMLVLQFGFDPDDPHSPHRLRNHAQNRLVYSSTHDADTVRGWYESLPPDRRAEVDAAVDAAGVREPDVSWSLIRLTFSSAARVAMTQAQDILGLGSEARMNVPGQIGKAWKWKLAKPLSRDLANRLREATAEAKRL